MSILLSDRQVLNLKSNSCNYLVLLQLLFQERSDVTDL